MKDKPVIAITMGDPCGIGPEVTAKALADGDMYDSCHPVVIGTRAVMEEALRLIKGHLSCRVVSSPIEATGQPGVIDLLDLENLDVRKMAPGRLSPEAGRASMEWVIRAAEMCMAGDAQAMVTAPINKEAARLAGYEDVGHMEVLQRLSGASEVATMLMSGRLRVVHLTTHRSLRLACDYVTKENILAKLRLTHRCFKEWGFPHPRIGVSALNPHASDGGLLGDEEAGQIAPAVEEARREGIDAKGPIPADTVFNMVIDGLYDVALAMYHDQGHIPVKVYGFEKSVGVNLGLPFIRTSVDHGTAFDIAGEGIAKHESMQEAIRVAVALVSRNRLG